MSVDENVPFSTESERAKLRKPYAATWRNKQTLIGNCKLVTPAANATSIDCFSGFTLKTVDRCIVLKVGQGGSVKRQRL